MEGHLSWRWKNLVVASWSGVLERVASIPGGPGGYLSKTGRGSNDITLRKKNITGFMRMLSCSLLQEIVYERCTSCSPQDGRDTVSVCDV